MNQVKNLEFKVNVVIAPIQESVVIQDTTLNPTLNHKGTARVQYESVPVLLEYFCFVTHIG